MYVFQDAFTKKRKKERGRKEGNGQKGRRKGRKEEDVLDSILRNILKNKSGLAWWLTPVIPALWKPRWVDHEVRSSRPAWPRL